MARRVIETAGPRSRRAVPWAPATGLVALVVMTVGVVTVISVVAGTWPYTALGNGDPGLLVRLGTPLLRLVADAAAALCVGALVFAVFLTDTAPTGRLRSPADAALRSAGRWAGLWFLAAAVLVPFDVADQSGQSLTGPTSAGVVSSTTAGLGLWTALETPVAWLVTAALALAVALACRVVRCWRPAVAVLAVALLAVLPPPATGHSASDAGHDLATEAIVVHVPVAVVWVGVLAACLRPAWRRGLPEATLWRRYRRLALGCWLLLVVTGLVDAAVLVPPGQLLTTGYGRLLLATVVLSAVVGVLLWRRADRGPAPGVVRLAAGELVLLAATGATAVGLTHLAPPAFVGPPVTPSQTLLGYDLAGPPTVARLLLDWRVEPLFALLALLLAGAYVAGVRRLRRQGRRWPAGRAASWLAGCLVLLVATSSGVGRYAAAMFSVHMAAHMAIGMLAPILLALGGPLTLAREVLPRSTEVPGAREWLDALVESRPLRLLTHPAVAVVFLVAAPFALYGTGLFDAAVRFHWAHVAIYVVFLLIGYLFAWPAVGVDPTSRPLPAVGRLGLLLTAMPFDVVFGAMLISGRTVIGNGSAAADMYSALGLPWVRDLLADQRLAGELALLIGEVALQVAVVALVVRWRDLDLATGHIRSGGANLTTLAPRGHP
jgi:putative copper resistance protein D